MNALRHALRSLDRRVTTYRMTGRAVVRPRRATGRGTTFLAPANPPGSLGDEAFVLGLTAELQSAGRSVKVLLPGKGPSWPGVDPDLVVALPQLFERRVGQAERDTIDSLGAGDRVILIGADTLDGAYDSSMRDRHLGFALAAAARGAAVDVVSFSLCRSGDRPTLLRLVLKVADRVIARDALSVTLCREVYGRSAQLAPDAAFLVPSPRGGSSWNVGGSLVLNLSTQAEHHRPAEGGDLATIVAHGVAAEAAGRLVLTVPHDVRPRSGDLESLDRLEEALSQFGIQATRPSDPHPAPSAVRQLLHGSSLVVTGRMHLAIAAFSVGVPVVGLSYHDKWEGLWDLFDLPDDLLLDVRTTGADDIAAACRFALDHGRDLAAHILERSREAAGTARLQAGTAINVGTRCC